MRQTMYDRPVDTAHESDHCEDSGDTQTCQPIRDEYCFVLNNEKRVLPTLAGAELLSR